jgi:hypothetical protein
MIQVVDLPRPRSREPYAHARARDLYEESAAAEAAFAYLAMGRTLLSQAKSVQWRRMMAIRTATIARAIRLCERALGCKYVGRQKEPRAWLLRGDVAGVVVPVIRIEWDHLRRLNEAPNPVRVAVLQRGLVDELRLQRMLGATAYEQEKAQ